MYKWEPRIVRTQIYLTAEERERLAALAAATGRKQSELIREAVDQYLDESRAGVREEALAKAAGIWKDRDDLRDFRALRREWDRGG